MDEGWMMDGRMENAVTFLTHNMNTSNASKSLHIVREFDTTKLFSMRPETPEPTAAPTGIVLTPPLR